MGGDDAPALGEANPGLHLPPDPARGAVTPEQRRRDGAIPAVGDDAGLLELARKASRRARGSERLDRLVSKEVLGAPKADCGLAWQEEAIERLDIIVDKRALVIREGGFNLGLRLRIVDRHGRRFRLSIDWRSALRKGMSANWSARTLSQATPCGCG